MPELTEKRRLAKQREQERRRQGARCVDCDRRTEAVNEVGEPQCRWCQRELREATEHATAECSCGNPMLAPAPMCGLCAAELESVRANA